MKYRFLLLLLLVNFCTQVSANLLVSPTRVIFEGRDRTKDIVLINTTNDERSYRIGWEEKAVNQGGRYIDITEGKTNSAASSYIRYSPRQVTLKPGERQIVKLMLRRKNSMDRPEYRSHIMFTALPLIKNQKDLSAEGVSLKVNILTSYSLPVMIRTATPDITVKIENITIKRENEAQPVIQVELSKTGVFSATGNINVYFRANGEEEEKKVGILNGVNIFHEASVLKAKIRWLNYTGPLEGTLRAKYVGHYEFSGRTFDEASQEVSITDF
jgi:fimbrial chaperone protein